MPKKWRVPCSDNSTQRYIDKIVEAENEAKSDQLAFCITGERRSSLEQLTTHRQRLRKRSAMTT